MFANAYRTASEFTRPVIISTRQLDGNVHCSVAAFLILNPKGWIATAAHVFDSLMLFRQHEPLVAEYQGKVRAIEAGPVLEAKQRARRIKQLGADPKWLVNHSFWWGWDGIQLQDVKLLQEADLAVGRLSPWDPGRVGTYPVIKDPSKAMDVGTSLCKLGYPFHEVTATYDESQNAFHLAPGTLPIPRFPLDGIYTRNAVQGKTSDGRYTIKFLETSSPGLRGQSGGPIFDREAVVWGLQSRTVHLPLGFNPPVIKNGRRVEEHQFLNVGLGVHAEVITAFLADNKISFQKSTY